MQGLLPPATQPAQDASLSPARMVMCGAGKWDKHLPRFEETSILLSQEVPDT